jgi:hypothetical protein
MPDRARFGDVPNEWGGLGPMVAAISAVGAAVRAPVVKQDSSRQPSLVQPAAIGARLLTDTKGCGPGANARARPSLGALEIRLLRHRHMIVELIVVRGANFFLGQRSPLNPMKSKSCRPRFDESVGIVHGEKQLDCLAVEHFPPLHDMQLLRGRRAVIVEESLVVQPAAPRLRL